MEGSYRISSNACQRLVLGPIPLTLGDRSHLCGFVDFSAPHDKRKNLAECSQARVSEPRFPNEFA